MGQSQKLHNSPNGTTIEGVVLDVNYLNHATFGDKALRVEILGLFQAQLDGLVKNIMLPIDAQGWLFLTHTLRGAAASVGAQHIAHLAEQWGQMPAPQSAEARSAVVLQLKTAITDFVGIASKLQ